MGQALPKPALRPFLAEDTPVLAAIFVAAIEELTGEDYTEAQQQAWAGAADDENQFGQRLAELVFVVGSAGPGLLLRLGVVLPGQLLDRRDKDRGEHRRVLGKERPQRRFGQSL